MTALLCIMGLSFSLGLALIPCFRRLALRVGLVDQPDGRRKIHRRPIPLSGGLAIFLAASGAVLAAVWFTPAALPNLAEKTDHLLGLLLGGAVICGVGLLDDYRGLRGRHKLLGQLAAIGIVIASGVLVREVHLFHWHIDLGVLAIPFTVFWLLGAVNSLNLIDGMDGLLGSMGLILCLAMAALALASGHMVTAAVAVALAGALGAFLCFNLPPASIFMGDCGSMLVGLVIGVLAIHSSLKAPATVALAAPVALLIIPIFDTLAAITRRTLTGRSLYSTDRGHIHHCLLRSGLSGLRVLGLVSSLCLLVVFGALGSLAFNNEILAVIAAVTVVGLLIVSRLFGYVEFLLIKERLRGLAVALLRGNVEKEGCQISVRLQGSADWPELWQSLMAWTGPLNLRSLHLDVNAPALHEAYHARWERAEQDEGEVASTWRTEMPLVAGRQQVGRLSVAGLQDDVSFGDRVIAVARLAREVERAVAQLTAVRLAPPPPPPPIEAKIGLLAEQAGS
jgi:UDP-GlcNAc:undecaprenyl-phosphate/decaprenyl-phosphate GlcNAc-1-phosphate transferase